MKRKRYEIIITAAQYNELVQDRTIVIHNVRPDSYIEILQRIPEKEKAALGRLIEEKSLHKEGRI